MKRFFIVMCAVCVISSCLVFSASAAENEFPYGVDVDKYPYWFGVDVDEGLEAVYVFSEYPLEVRNGVLVFANDQDFHRILIASKNVWRSAEESATAGDSGTLYEILDIYDPNVDVFADYFVSNYIDYSDLIPEDQTIIQAVSKVFSSAMNWVRTIATTMVSKPILMLFVILPLVGLGVGLFKRIKD